MCAVAHGLLGCGLAPAKIHLTGFFSGKFNRFKTGVFMRPVAKWLARGFPATALEICFSLLHGFLERRFLRNICFIQNALP